MITILLPRPLRAACLLGMLLLAAGPGLRAEPVQPNTPLEVNLQIHNGAVALEFDSAADKIYQIEFSRDLVTWDREGYPFKGTGGHMARVASGRGLDRAYYRLRDDGDPQNIATANPAREWVAELPNRAALTVYTNLFPYEIVVSVRAVLTNASLAGRAVILTRRNAKSAWMLVAGGNPDPIARATDLSATIPAGWQYKLDFDLNTAYFPQAWNELK